MEPLTQQLALMMINVPEECKEQVAKVRRLRQSLASVSNRISAATPRLWSFSKIFYDLYDLISPLVHNDTMDRSDPQNRTRFLFN